jgi:hypothetical protein
VCVSIFAAPFGPSKKHQSTSPLLWNNNAPVLIVSTTTNPSFQVPHRHRHRHRHHQIMGFLNRKELRKKRLFGFRKNKGQTQDPPGQATTKQSIEPIAETPNTVAEVDGTPGSSSTGSSTSWSSSIASSQDAEQGSPDFVHTPIKNLLGELNLVEDDEDGMELVLGPIPPKKTDPEESKEGTDKMMSPSEEAPAKIPYDAEEVKTEEASASVPAAQEKDDTAKLASVPNKEDKDQDFPDDENPLNLSPDDENPQNLSPDPAGRKQRAFVKTADPRVVVVSPDDVITKATTPAADDKGPTSTKWEGAEDTARKLLGVFNCTTDAGACIPEDLKNKVIETACDDACQPIVVRPEKRGMKRNLSYYNDQFAVKFLDVS